MAEKKISSGFLRQAGILAVAGIISRIIGLLYRVPITAIIGDQGNGYYGAAYEIYAVVLLISSYSIPMAVSKIISERLALKEYRNVYKIFKCSLIYVLVVGGIASLLTFIFAKELVDVNGGVLPLRIMAPTILLSGILSVFRGYFQAYNTMVPTSVSQILEQILNCIVSITAAYIFVTAATDPNQIPVVGAAGSALGTGVGVLIGLVFMIFIFLMNKNTINKYLRRDKTQSDETYKDIFKIILLTVTPVIFSTFIYNVSTSLDMKIYFWVMDIKGYTEEKMTIGYGIFSGKYRVLQNVPIAISSAVSSAMIPSIAASYIKNDLDATKRNIGIAIRGTMFISIPAAVGMGVLAGPIMELLFPGTVKTAGMLLSAGCISIILYAISTISNGALQGIGRMKEPLKNAIIALIIHSIVIVLLLFFTKWNLFAILISTIVYALSMCILNQYSIRKYLGYKQEIKNTFLGPGFASLIMGAFAYASYTLLYMVTKINSISVIVAIFVASIIYFIIIMKLGVVSEEELNRLPKGRFMVRVARKTRLLK